MGVSGLRLAPAALSPISILWESRWASGPVWKGVEHLVLPGFDPCTFGPVAG